MSDPTSTSQLHSEHSSDDEFFDAEDDQNAALSGKNVAVTKDGEGELPKEEAATHPIPSIPPINLAASLAKRLASETLATRRGRDVLLSLPPVGGPSRQYVESEVWLEVPVEIARRQAFMSAIDHVKETGVEIAVDDEIDPSKKVGSVATGGMQEVLGAVLADTVATNAAILAQENTGKQTQLLTAGNSVPAGPVSVVEEETRKTSLARTFSNPDVSQSEDLPSPMRRASAKPMGPPPVPTVPIWLAGTHEAVTVARKQLLQRACLLRPNSMAGAYRARKPGRIQVFVDNSNIYLGAMYAFGPEADRSDRTIRINVPQVVDLVERRRPAGMKKVVGANPDETDPMWDEWRDCGYDVRVGLRASNNVEQFVDDALHSEILRTLIMHKEPQTLVLLSGDGNPNGGGTTFPWCCKEACKRGWAVEVHAWGAGLSSEYLRLQRQFPGQMEVFILDDIKHYISFRQIRAPKPQLSPRSPRSPGLSPIITPRSSTSPNRSPRSPTPRISLAPNQTLPILRPNIPTPLANFPSPVKPTLRHTSSGGLEKTEQKKNKDKSDPAIPPCWRGMKCSDEKCNLFHPNGRHIDGTAGTKQLAKRPSLALPDGMGLSHSFDGFDRINRGTPEISMTDHSGAHDRRDQDELVFDFDTADAVAGASRGVVPDRKHSLVPESNGSGDFAYRVGGCANQIPPQRRHSDINIRLIRSFDDEPAAPEASNINSTRQTQAHPQLRDRGHRSDRLQAISNSSAQSFSAEDLGQCLTGVVGKVERLTAPQDTITMCRSEEDLGDALRGPRRPSLATTYITPHHTAPSTSSNQNPPSPKSPKPTNPKEAAFASCRKALVAGDNTRILRQQLSEGHITDVNEKLMVSRAGETGQTILMAAGRYGRLGCVEMLLREFKADIDAAEARTGFTALHYAAYFGHAAVVKGLLDAGADHEIRTKKRETAEQLALRQGHDSLSLFIRDYVARQRALDEEGSDGDWANVRRSSLHNRPRGGSLREKLARKPSKESPLSSPRMGAVQSNGTPLRMPPSLKL